MKSVFIVGLLFLQISCLNVKNNRDDIRPNVIIILTDDQGYGDLAAHGNELISTPNMDKLYKESVRFTDFHVAPMCTPTRGMLLTGVDAFRNGAIFVTQGRSEIHQQFPTMADVFAENGYATGHFGKWHLGDNYPYRPQDRGFQETIHHGAWGITSMVDFWSNDYYDDTYSHNGQYESYPGYCTDVWFDEAMKWMKKQKDQDKPFFIYIPTNVPHVPLIVNDNYLDAYKDKVPLNVAAFYGMISQCDENLGRLELFLEQNELKENTIFVFMTDNGTDQGQNVYNAGMRGKKTSHYDGGHRVPFFIRWPAKGITGGKDINELTHVTDVLPTLTNLCGIQGLDDMNGLDLSPLIFGKEESLTDRKIVISFRELNPESSAVLWNKWRLVNGEELYNIEQDPAQATDISSQYPEIYRDMKDHLDRWYEEMLPLQDQKDLISIGTRHEPETFLSSANWIGDYCDSYQNIVRNPAKFGYWDLQVSTSGTYQISLHRWDKESDLALDESFVLDDNNVMRDGPLTIAPLPVTGGSMTIGSKHLSKQVGPGATEVNFEVELNEGDQMKLEARLLDSDGQDLCGAYFTYIKKIN